MRPRPSLPQADTILLQFEIPLATVYHTIHFAKSNGIRCIVNPAPALPLDFKEIAAADYFMPNESEAEAITGIPVHTLEEARKCADICSRGDSPASSLLWASAARCWRHRRVWN